MTAKVDSLCSSTNLSPLDALLEDANLYHIFKSGISMAKGRKFGGVMWQKRGLSLFFGRDCLKCWNEKVPGESLEIQILIVSITKVKSHFVIEKTKLSKLFGFMTTGNHLPTIF